MMPLVVVCALLGQVNGVDTFTHDGNQYQYVEAWELPLYTQYWYSVDGQPVDGQPAMSYTVDGGTWDTAPGAWVSSVSGAVELGDNMMPVGSSAWLDSEGGGLFGYSPPPVVNVPVELVPVIQGFLDEIVKVVQAVILAWFGFLVLRKGIRWLSAYFAEKKLKAQYWDYGNGFYQGEKNRIYQFRNGRMHRMDGMYAGEDGNVYRGRGRDRRQVF